jgi:hypothetical protein
MTVDVNDLWSRLIATAQEVVEDMLAGDRPPDLWVIVSRVIEQHADELGDDAESCRRPLDREVRRYLAERNTHPGS